LRPPRRESVGPASRPSKVTLMPARRGVEGPHGPDARRGVVGARPGVRDVDEPAGQRGVDRHAARSRGARVRDSHRHDRRRRTLDHRGRAADGDGEVGRGRRGDGIGLHQHRLGPGALAVVVVDEQRTLGTVRREPRGVPGDRMRSPLVLGGPAPAEIEALRRCSGERPHRVERGGRWRQGAEGGPAGAVHPPAERLARCDASSAGWRPSSTRSCPEAGVHRVGARFT
jgi:hypothetical protein